MDDHYLLVRGSMVLKLPNRAPRLRQLIHIASDPPGLPNLLDQPRLVALEQGALRSGTGRLSLPSGSRISCSSAVADRLDLGVASDARSDELGAPLSSDPEDLVELGLHRGSHRGSGCSGSGVPREKAEHGRRRVHDQRKYPNSEATARSPQRTTRPTQMMKVSGCPVIRAHFEGDLRENLVHHPNIRDGRAPGCAA